MNHKNRYDVNTLQPLLAAVPPPVVRHRVSQRVYQQIDSWKQQPICLGLSTFPPPPLTSERQRILIILWDVPRIGGFPLGWETLCD